MNYKYFLAFLRRTYLIDVTKNQDKYLFPVI